MADDPASIPGEFPGHRKFRLHVVSVGLLIVIAVLRILGGYVRGTREHRNPPESWGIGDRRGGGRPDCLRIGSARVLSLPTIATGGKPDFLHGAAAFELCQSARAEGCNVPAGGQRLGGTDAEGARNGMVSATTQSGCCTQRVGPARFRSR